jgi:hypothetical protein
MSDPEIHHKETQCGFEFGQAKVERLWSHKGAVCLRVSSRETGQYVEITLSPGGRKLWTSAGKITDKSLGIHASTATPSLVKADTLP